MDTSYIPLAIAVIGGIVWLVRLEGKVNAHSDKILKLDQHTEDENRHFNHPAFEEFKLRLQTEINNIKEAVTEVKEYCEDIDKKVDQLKTDLKV